MKARRRQRGFTLTEMMVVISIIGVLVAMVLVYAKPRSRPIDVANRVGDLLHEASRRAVALGPVRANVAIAQNAKTRTHLIASVAGTTVTFTLEHLQENAVLTSTAATWVFEQSYTVDTAVLCDSWSTGVGSKAALTTTPGINANFATFTVPCRPDGTCDARSIFFTAATQRPGYESYARLSIMPLGAAITTRTDWN